MSRSRSLDLRFIEPTFGITVVVLRFGGGAASMVRCGISYSFSIGTDFLLNGPYIDAMQHCKVESGSWIREYLTVLALDVPC